MNEFLIVGIGAGFLQTLIGHPFDTMKTWRQTKQVVPMRYLYRGSISSFHNNTLQNTILFSIYERIHGQYPNHFFSGSCAGVVSALFISPLECIKIHHQLRIPLSKMEPWSGIGCTVLRDGIGFGVYFASYAHLPMESVLIRGGIAGLLSWIVSYPFDVHKTMKQSKMEQKVGYYEGFSFVCIRSILVNASIFWYYDFIKNRFSNT